MNILWINIHIILHIATLGNKNNAAAQSADETSLVNYYLYPAFLSASELGASQLQIYSISRGWGKY